METKTCVLIADIDEDFRRLLGDVLSQEDDMECVGNTDNGVEALTLAAERQPDVLVMDLVLLKLDGIEVLRRLPEACPGAKAIVVTHMFGAFRMFEGRAETGSKSFLEQGKYEDEYVKIDENGNLDPNGKWFISQLSFWDTLCASPQDGWDDKVIQW